MIAHAQRLHVLPDLLAQYAVLPDRPLLMAARTGGRWVPYSSHAIVRTVRFLALGLRAAGLEPGDRIAIAVRPSPFWMMYDLAALSAGCVTVPVFPDLPLDQVARQVQDAGVRAVFVDGPLHAERLLSVLADDVRLIGRGVSAHGPRYLSFDQCVAVGHTRERTHPVACEDELRGPAPEDLATIIYTSGSTGAPKGVELTHANLISQTQGATERFPLDGTRDTALSILPLAHVFERMIAYTYLRTGVPVYFADDIRNVAQHLQDVRPTVLTVVPRVLERVHDRMVDRVEALTGLCGRLGRMAVSWAETEQAHRWDFVAETVFQGAVFARFREAMGGRLRMVVSGGAPLSASLCRFYDRIGVPIYNGYGLTEAAPVLTTNDPQHNRVGSVGRAFPGVRLRIASDGEIQARGPNIMRGYHERPDETAAAFTHDAWLHTGDLGRLEPDGTLYITGRKKDLFKTSTGKYVCPAPLEEALAALREIDTAVVVAESRKCVSCLVFPDPDRAAALGAAALRELVARHIEAVNASVEPWQRVRHFHIVNEPPSTENGLRTPTAKIRRQEVEQRFADIIDAMYGEVCHA